MAFWIAAVFRVAPSPIAPILVASMSLPARAGPGSAMAKETAKGRHFEKEFFTRGHGTQK